MRVAEYLHFDVARIEDVFFDQHAIVAERRGRLAAAGQQQLVEPRRRLDPAHPLAAAARDRLDQYGIADRVRLCLEVRRRLVLSHIAGGDRDAGGDHALLGGILQPHRPDRRRRRADPDQPRRLHRLGEPGIFREEAVAGVDRLGAGRVRGGEDGGLVEIAVARRRRPDAHRLVRLAHERHLRVGVRVDRDRAHAHRPRGADDTPGDLPPVGDQNRPDHGHIRKMPNRAWSGIGAFSVAAKARPSTSRVWTGSMMPSSQSRAVA